MLTNMFIKTHLLLFIFCFNYWNTPKRLHTWSLFWYCQFLTQFRPCCLTLFWLYFRSLKLFHCFRMLSWSPLRSAKSWVTWICQIKFSFSLFLGFWTDFMLLIFLTVLRRLRFESLWLFFISGFLGIQPLYAIFQMLWWASAAWHEWSWWGFAAWFWSWALWIIHCIIL